MALPYLSNEEDVTVSRSMAEPIGVMVARLGSVEIVAAEYLTMTVVPILPETDILEFVITLTSMIEAFVASVYVTITWLFATPDGSKLVERISWQFKSTPSEGLVYVRTLDVGSA